MKQYMNALMLSMWIGMQTGINNAMGTLKKENGDTNLISIIIVLGIVLALVVVFRGYISSILSKISGAVNSFNNNEF